MAPEGKLFCKIVTPDSTVFEDDVNTLILPGAEGKFGILHNHIAYLAILDAGVISLERDGSREYVACGGGYTEINDNNITILVESAEFSEDIDEGEVQDQLHDAQKRLKEKQLEDTEREDTLHEIKLARARLDTVDKTE